MAVSHGQEAAGELIAANCCPGFIPVQHPVFVLMIVLSEVRILRFEMLHVTGLGSHLDETRFQVTFDVVAIDSLPDDLVTAPDHLPQRLFKALTHTCCNLAITTEAVNQLPAVATGGAPADAVCFDYYDGIPPLCERQGG